MIDLKKQVTEMTDLKKQVTALFARVGGIRNSLSLAVIYAIMETCNFIFISRKALILQGEFAKPS
jgi:hypothetical protein